MMELHGMADELTREGVTQRLEEIFAAALDGDELEKLISSIPKRLDKYEGRWDGLIGWAEKKYGKPETDESEEKPTKKKRGGMFSRLGKSKKEDDPPQDAVEGEPQAVEESEEEEKPAKKKPAKKKPAKKKPAKKKRGGLFSRLGKSKEEAEPTEADEPEEATEDEQVDEEHDDAADLEGDEAPLEKAARLLEGGDSEGALEVWKGLVRSDGGNPEVWRGLASYFASAGRTGRAQACEEHADELP